MTTEHKLRVALKMCVVALEVNKLQWITLLDECSLCTGCGASSPHLEYAADPLSIQHKEKCPYRAYFTALDSSAAALALPQSATLCEFVGPKDDYCQACGKSWHSPDHQAPLFDPKEPR